MPLKINEIFYSIQGESLHTGRPCVFIRLSGCNLRCSYCDTEYAYENGTDTAVRDIISRVAEYDCRLVEITGGEPLLQDDTPLLITGLLDGGFQVLMETNGSLDISRVEKRCVRIVDVKCPSSGMQDKNDPDNFNRLNAHDQVKFVIGDRGDYVYAKQTAMSQCGAIPLDHVLFSPVSGILNPSRLAGWILEDGLDVRFQLQMHRIIWPGVERGV